jgi:hypothetical protein
MLPTTRRPAPARAGDRRALAFAGTLALLGTLAIAHSPAARGAAAAARSIAGTVTCSLAAACLVEMNRGGGPAVTAAATGGAGLLATSTSGVAAIAKSRGPGGIEAYNGGSSAGADIFALDSTPAGNGIYAVSQRGIAGYFENTASGGVANSDVALVARAGTAGARSPVLDVADSRNDAVASFDDSGDLTLAGELYTAGNCSQGCARRERVVSFVPRESEPMAEDAGEAFLAGGRAEVALEPGFAKTIDARRPYLVTLTPEGESRGLYVARRDARGFTVREAQAGRSSIPFAYRISAKPFGVRDVRLPAIDLVAPDHAARAILAR